MEEIYDKWSACKMGIEEQGQICVMIHSGSRGFGHQVATGYFDFTTLFPTVKYPYFFASFVRRCFDISKNFRENHSETIRDMMK